MAALCVGGEARPDSVAIMLDEKYQPAMRGMQRRLYCLVAAVLSLMSLTVILIALVAWLGVRVHNFGAAAWPLGPVVLTKGKPSMAGYGSYGSLFRGSGAWAVAPDPTPWGGLSDHLVLSNGSTPLNGTTKVVILGGMNLTSWFQSAVWSYDPVYEQYAEMPPMPVVRTRFAATVAYNLLVVAGGYAGPTVLNDSMANTLNQTNTLDVFDFNTNTWRANVAQMSVLRSDSCAAFANGLVYIIGGYDWAFNILNTVEVFNPVTNKISLGIPIPEPRGDVGCSSYGNIVYVHGGYYDPSGQFAGGCHKNTTWALDVTNLGAGWVRKADMNSPRGDHAFTTLSDGRFLVMGGENDVTETNDKTPIRSVEMYNIDDDTWSEKAPMIYARFRFSAGTVTSPTVGDSTVYAFNGHQLCMNGSSNDTVCATHASNSLSVYSNLEHPDVFVQLANGIVDPLGS